MDSTVTLTDGMAFDVAIGDHHFVIDAKAEHGGADKGPSPKSLMMSSLAGCASMDVISILRKMRVPPDTFAVSASADLTDEHPKTFVNMTVRVVATGDVPAGKLWKAVALSRDRYCGVAAMLRAHGPIHYIVELNGEEVPEPS
jgi:putative redox protein